MNFPMSLKEEWDVKEEDSPSVFIEVSLEVKQEDADDSSVFHSVENCTTNNYKVMIYSVDLLVIIHNNYLGKGGKTITEIKNFPS